MLFQLPAKSRIIIKDAPENIWSWQEVLINKSNHWLGVLAWQNTEDGQSKNPKNTPEMFVPDFIEKKKKEPTMDIDEVKALLARDRRSV